MRRIVYINCYCIVCVQSKRLNKWQIWNVTLKRDETVRYIKGYDICAIVLSLFQHVSIPYCFQTACL